MIGLIYGACVVYLAVLCAGGGHGTALPVCLTGAPLSLSFFLFLPSGPLFGMHIEWYLLATTPLVWMLLAWLAALAHRKVGRRAFCTVVVVHYVTGLTFMFSGEFGSWELVEHTWQYMPGIVLAWLSLYLLGHIALWGWYGIRRRFQS
jgi:hypothetical protein